MAHKPPTQPTSKMPLKGLGALASLAANTSTSASNGASADTTAHSTAKPSANKAINTATNAAANTPASVLVYSTEVGTTCPHCRQALNACSCADPDALLGDGRVRVLLDKRKGKQVTVVSGLALNATDLNALGKLLRQACGCGGTTKDGAIEVQGEHVHKCAQWLRSNGHNVVQPKA